ncbi:hypothetical protein MIMGU_mgv1a019280mg, partial [Erythranthe guttata]
MNVKEKLKLFFLATVGLMPKGGFSETWFIPLHVAMICNADSLLAPQRGHAVLCPLYYYYQRQPWNYFLLGTFTLSLAFAVGLTCAFTSGKVILESVILTAAVMISLTLYTFWAAKRGHNFNFLGPFHFGAFSLFNIKSSYSTYKNKLRSKYASKPIIFFPLGRISVMIYGSIIFFGYIVYDTDNLIKRYMYDQYIWAAVALYLDVINLFLSLMTVFRVAD